MQEWVGKSLSQGQFIKHIFYCFIALLVLLVRFSLVLYFLSLIIKDLEREKLEVLSCVTGWLSVTQLLTLYQLLLLNFNQHVSGPPHTKGHTLDVVFSFGLNISNLCVNDIHLGVYCCAFFNLSFPLEPSPVKCRIVKPVITQDVLWFV